MKNEKYIPALRYDWLTPFYDSAVRLTTREITFKKALLEQIQSNPFSRILDVGCGTGTLTILLKKRYPQAEVVGLDGDARILEIAERKAGKASFRIQFKKGMSYDLPFQNESFDCVVSSLFLHHLTRKNKLKTFREVRRVLKPEGEFHVADWGLPANSLMRAGSYFVQLLDGKETTADSFNGSLPELLAESGFRKIKETAAFNTLFGTIRLHKSQTS